MKKQSRALPILLFVLSGFFAVLGIGQLAVIIPANLENLQYYIDYYSAGPEEISLYYRQNFVPQWLAYFITAFGIAAILFAAAFIILKLNAIADTRSSANEETEQLLTYDSESADEEEMDEILDGLFKGDEETDESVEAEVQ